MRSDVHALLSLSLSLSLCVYSSGLWLQPRLLLTEIGAVQASGRCPLGAEKGAKDVVIYRQFPFVSLSRSAFSPFAFFLFPVSQEC
ncbi:hypothetical protein KP509_33G032200 [Ceratopteris richardii]|uniref:Secreted protein n=1 Tax=Ceratopteris richardii TaxID=49495 RepID=A0A8T2QMY3_CERRI|nr:hypothetical protein KP509_33G032200 [Ceratopteris richardii]